MTKLPMGTTSQFALVYPGARAEMLRAVEAAVFYDTCKTLRVIFFRILLSTHSSPLTAIRRRHATFFG
jgi:hypothetical protein